MPPHNIRHCRRVEKELSIKMIQMYCKSQQHGDHNISAEGSR